MGPIAAPRVPNDALALPDSHRPARKISARLVAVVVVLSLLLPAGRAIAENMAPSQAPPPPVPQQSRKGGQGAAKAMAIAGAAFAGAMCLLMLQKAEQAQSENEKMMYQMMAMQECKQVPESLKNAGDNEKGENAMTQPAQAPPQQAQAATSAPFQMPSEAPKQEAKAEETPAIPTFQPLAMPTSGVVPQQAFDGEKGDDKLTTTKGAQKGVAVEGTTDLQAIQPAKVGFDESSTSNSPVSTVGGNGAGVFGVGGAAADAKNAADGKTDGDKKDGIGRQASKTQAEAGAGGEGGGAAAGNANGKPGDIDALIAQLMGGHGGDAGTLNMGSTSGGLAVGGSKGADGEELPNIFEYATFRYRELVDEEKLLFDGSIESHRKARLAKKDDAGKPQKGKEKEKRLAKTEPQAPSRGPASVPAPSAAAAPALADAHNGGKATNATQAQLDARLAPSKVRMAGGLK